MTLHEIFNFARHTTDAPPASGSSWTIELYDPFDRVLAKFQGGESNSGVYLLRGILADSLRSEVRERASTKAGAAGSTRERAGIRCELDDLLRGRERARSR